MSTNSLPITLEHVHKSAILTLLPKQSHKDDFNAQLSFCATVNMEGIRKIKNWDKKINLSRQSQHFWLSIRLKATEN